MFIEKGIDKRQTKRIINPKVLDLRESDIKLEPITDYDRY